MIGTELIYWLCLVGVVALYAVLVYLAWRALFKDRARGRRRCPRCWHDLSHTPGMTCSECGIVAPRERHLGRTRRYWGRAVVVMMLCVALAGTIYWQVGDRGWESVIPSSMLVTVLPYTGDSGGVYRELTHRIATRELSEGQWRRLVVRAARGDWANRPPGQGWATKYGRLIDNRVTAIANDDTLEWDERELAAVLSVPPRLDITSRAVWPVGHTPRLRVQMTDWWPRGERRLRLAPDVEGAEPVTVYRGDARAWAGFGFGVEGVDPEARSIRVEVEVAHRDQKSPHEPWKILHTRTIEVPVRFDSAAQVHFEPFDDAELLPALNQAIADTFETGAVRWTSGTSPVRFSFTPQDTYVPQFDGVAVGVHVDVLREGQLARRLTIWWLAGTGVTDRGIGWESSGEDLGLLMAMDEDDTAWQMRVTSDPEVALRAGDAPMYWQGEVSLPLRIQERSSPAPPRPWWRAEEATERRSGEATKAE